MYTVVSNTILFRRLFYEPPNYIKTFRRFEERRQEKNQRVKKASGY
jgi:hypothetical protein